ncbi:MAG: hypothetical protein KatS3mg005_0432 [Bryobacteraceae bacterium]|nr:MAG: hypothetical protein KatS3mg005_0432 [Bryobacteraceae bacterium]
MRRRVYAHIAVSLLLIAPVLLQKHVQAGDLASHLYNAWLVLLVKSGEPLGLEIVPQYSNVMFDWWLEGLWRIGGPAFAEKAAVSVSLLLFFWGAFFLFTRLTERSAWPMAPLLAMLAYSWIWFQGFFNYYLACAFSFWAIGLAASAGRHALLALPLLGLAALSHLLGAAVGAGFTLFALARRRLPPRYGRWLFPAACLALAVSAAILPLHLRVTWQLSRLMHLTAATPFWLHDARYFIPALVVIGYAVWILLAALDRRTPLGLSLPAPQMAALAAAALILLPTSLDWPGTHHSLHFIDWRLAPWLTLFLLAWLARLAAARLSLIAGLAAASLFFSFLVLDWRLLGRIEQAFHDAVRQVPARSRVVNTVTTLPLGINPLLHPIDRACIGHCFSYGNYEPATAQFRLRSRPGAAAAMSSMRDVSALHHGQYVVKPGDLPLFGVFLRGKSPFTLSVRPLEAEEHVRIEVISLQEVRF